MFALSSGTLFTELLVRRVLSCGAQSPITYPTISIFECHVTLCDLWLELSILTACGSVPRFLSLSLSPHELDIPTALPYSFSRYMSPSCPRFPSGVLGDASIGGTSL